MKKSKRLSFKTKRSVRRRLPPIQPGDRIDYRNLRLISRFISKQGKILSRRVNRLTLKQQRLITFAIKQARILSLLPFRNSGMNPLEKRGAPARTPSLKTRNRKTPGSGPRAKKTPGSSPRAKKTSGSSLKTQKKEI